MLMGKTTENSYFKTIDADKLRKFIRDESKFKSDAEICRAIGVSSHCIADTKRRGGRIRIAFINNICHLLGVSEDYFDYVEPEPEPEPLPVGELEKKTETECLIDLADIQLSLNKIEALLLEQNRILRGRLEKGERTNEIKGNTNGHPANGYGIRHVSF